MSAKHSELCNAGSYDTEDTFILAQANVLEPGQQASRVRVVIADDHPLVRDALRTLLTLEEDIEVVGEASNAYEVINIANNIRPDLLILDLHMPQMDGIAALEALQRMDIKPKVIIFTAAEHPDVLMKAMQLGCDGIVLKQSASELIVNCIRTVAAGGKWFFDHAPAALIKQSDSPMASTAASSSINSMESPLSPREREIVTLVAQGYKNRQIADKMSLSEQTVKNHLNRIFHKTGVSDRLELVLYAVHAGLTTLATR